MNQIIFFIACGKITKNVSDEDNHIVSVNWFVSISFKDEDKKVKKLIWDFSGLLFSKRSIL